MIFLSFLQETLLVPRYFCWGYLNTGQKKTTPTLRMHDSVEIPSKLPYMCHCFIPPPPKKWVPFHHLSPFVSDFFMWTDPFRTLENLYETKKWFDRGSHEIFQPGDIIFDWIPWFVKVSIHIRSFLKFPGYVVATQIFFTFTPYRKGEMIHPIWRRNLFRMGWLKPPTRYTKYEIYVFKDYKRGYRDLWFFGIHSYPVIPEISRVLFYRSPKNIASAASSPQTRKSLAPSSLQASMDSWRTSIGLGFRHPWWRTDFFGARSFRKRDFSPKNWRPWRWNLKSYVKLDDFCF